MRSGEGVEEKERPVVFCLDEIDRFLSENVGQLAIEFHLFAIFFDRFGVAWFVILFGVVEITS